MANESTGQKVVGFLRKVFPIFQAGAVFGGPVAVAAAAAVGKALGTDAPAATPDAIEAAVAGASPDQLIALKKAEQDFQVQMAQIQLQYDQANAQFTSSDLASARQREVSIRDWMPKVLGSGVVSGFLVAVFLVLSGHAKIDSALAGTLIGYLSAKAEQVIAYYFGSSSGQARSTELLSQAPPIPKG